LLFISAKKVQKNIFSWKSGYHDIQSFNTGSYESGLQFFQLFFVKQFLLDALNVQSVQHAATLLKYKIKGTFYFQFSYGVLLIHSIAAHLRFDEYFLANFVVQLVWKSLSPSSNDVNMVTAAPF